MNEMKTLVLLLVLLMAGCAHIVTVRLNVPEDYAPPSHIPFSSPEDKGLHLEAHRLGWLDVATNQSYAADLKKHLKIVHYVSPGLYGPSFPEPMHKGRLDGIGKAETQLDDKVNQVFADAGQPWATKANKAMDGTAE